VIFSAYCRVAVFAERQIFEGVKMKWLSRVSDLLAQGRVFCLVTIVSSGQTDLPVGHKAIVLSDGAMEGEFGSALLDGVVRDLARKALSERQSDTVTAGDGARVYLDILSPDPKLLICGAGHIGLSLARIAREVGFRVTVLDNRSDFARPARFPGCDVIAEEYAHALQTIPLGPSSHVVVVTPGHDHDSECLEAILPKETAYIGLIGSRRRIRFVLEALAQKGIPRDRLNDIFTPIGLPLGSESPEEIALAIAAELVCVRRRGPLPTRALRTIPGGTA
jgi:xanthine dehydrogenase accessory factor